MLRFSVAFVVSLFAALPAVAADPVAEFEKLIRKATAETSAPSVYGTKTQKWVPRYRTLSDVKYDVKKTDSLVTPAVAEVSFLLVSKAGRAFDTKQEAEAATAADGSGLTQMEQVTLRYGWRADAWQYISGDETFWLTGPSVPAALPKAQVKLVLERISGAESTLRPWVP